MRFTYFYQTAITAKIMMVFFTLLLLLSIDSEAAEIANEEQQGVKVKSLNQVQSLNQVKPSSKAQSSNTSPLIIESQVKGSQEQPKVIYITPWQGIEAPIIIEGNTPKINMPQFKPINPKKFKQQSRRFKRVNSKNQKGK